MNKDIVISVLTAIIAAQNAYGITTREQIGIFIGTATTVFIFLLFLDDLHDKRMKKKKSVEKTRNTVERLRNLEIGEDHEPSRR